MIMFPWVRIREGFPYDTAQSTQWGVGGTDRFVVFLPCRKINSDGLELALPVYHFKSGGYSAFLTSGNRAYYAGVYGFHGMWEMEWDSFVNHFPHVGVTFRACRMKFLMR